MLLNIVLPRLGKRSSINLMLDTGADRTVIHPSGLSLLGIKKESLVADETVHGLGGEEKGQLEEASIGLFADDGRPVHIPTEIVLAIPTKSNERFASLLGRDLLRHFALTVDYPNQLVILELPDDSPVLVKDPRRRSPA